ncbi:MAG: SLC13 family permease [Salibacteraceae bacterium]|nr:SLC13 family permease [Salibacteraceae bacterium]
MQILKKLGFFLGPLLFLVLLFIPEQSLQTKVFAVGAWMLTWWIFEVFPIFITAMLPMVFFPALGILSVTDTFAPYGNPIIFLFLGGFIIALAMEERRLHERIAFGLIRLTGTKPRGIILGFMLATAIVAMWISNTATAVMMLPIALSVINLMRDQVQDETMLKRFQLLMMLAVAFAANIGGTVTLIGTPPNLVFAGYYFELTGQDFGFGRWLMIGIPVGFSLLFATYFVLTRLVYPIHSKPLDGVKELFDKKWKELGKMSLPEKLVLAVFSFTVTLWIFASPINDWLGTRALNNTNIAMAGGILMFIVPVSFSKSEFILDWKSTSRLPWGILILFGGGLCLANGLETAGIIDQIGAWVSDNVHTSPLVICIVLTGIALFATEVMSNVALVTVLLPVVIGIAQSMNIDPVYLSIPVTLAASCAFMMPISTPPNAVVYSSGYVTVGQMMKAGIWLNLLAIIIIVGLCSLLL